MSAEQHRRRIQCLNGFRIAAARHWLEWQHCFLSQRPQNYPRAGSQGYPSPEAEAAEDGSTTIWFGPDQPEGVGRGNWIQTDPEKGWVVILRLYSPLASFFDKSWQPSEIEPVTN